MDIKAFNKFREITVLVAGDLMLDYYVSGKVGRISPEAPVPVLDVRSESGKLGGSGNVVNNLHSLSAHTRVLSCIGQDQNGDDLLNLLEKTNADLRYIMRSPELMTTTKTRVVAGNQQIVRIDREIKTPYPDSFFCFAEENLDAIFDGVDVLILSDYGKGILTERVCQLLIDCAAKKAIPILVDPKGKDWRKYRGATMCTPNLSELSVVCDRSLDQSMEDDIRLNAMRLCEENDIALMLVTRSERGMSLVRLDGNKSDYPVVKKEVIDVSGAGDTVISTMALGMAAGFSDDDCCRLANLAASVVVSKFGTATASLSELIGSELFSVGKKHIRRDEIGYLTDYLRDQGKKIVFTNGCFDLVHTGHISSFEQARAFGDVLIVGINTDASVRRLKGELRPVVGEDDRAYLLQSLSVVDYVVMFDDDTPEELIRTICPDVLVKGKDYTGQTIVGQIYVEEHGGRVELIDLKAGRSTTSLIEKICASYGKGE